jgi:predicted NACHT family NTPase
MENFFVLPAFSREIGVGATLTVQTPIDIVHTFCRENSRELVIGPPGSGKTTCALWLQNQQLSGPEPRLAIVFPLRGLITTRLPKLVELFREAGGPHSLEEIESRHIARWRDAGLISLILDGFDEIPPSERDVVTEWLNDLEVAAGAMSIIITSRPLTSDHLHRLKSFSNRWEILPFDQSRVVEYISRWHEYSPLVRDDVGGSGAAGLADTWLNDPVIGPLTGNPLVLTTLLVVHHLDGDLPKSRAKLYERYLEGMLGICDEKRKVSVSDTDLSRVEKHRILSQVALHFHLKEIDQLDEKSLIELIRKVLDGRKTTLTASEILMVLRERTGLLVGPGNYSFVHKSVAEFLVAEAVFQGDRMRLFVSRTRAKT